MTPVLPWTLPFLKVCMSFNSWSNFCQRCLPTPLLFMF